MSKKIAVFKDRKVADNIIHLFSLSEGVKKRSKIMVEIDDHTVFMVPTALGTGRQVYWQIMVG